MKRLSHGIVMVSIAPRTSAARGGAYRTPCQSADESPWIRLHSDMVLSWYWSLSGGVIFTVWSLLCRSCFLLSPIGSISGIERTFGHGTLCNGLDLTIAWESDHVVSYSSSCLAKITDLL